MKAGEIEERTLALISKWTECRRNGYTVLDHPHPDFSGSSYIFVAFINRSIITPLANRLNRKISVGFTICNFDDSEVQIKSRLFLHKLMGLLQN